MQSFLCMILIVYLADTRIFMLYFPYFSGIKRTFVRKLICILFFKVVCVTNVTMIDENNDSSLQEYNIIAEQARE